VVAAETVGRQVIILLLAVEAVLAAAVDAFKAEAVEEAAAA
jgi:hypothetical protein